MEIKFTVEEYFEELKLMQEQYGQEEDLYPWIYMLLQMAQQSKEDKVSIRDVHNMSLKTSTFKEYTKKIRELITAKESVPDFVVFDNQEKNFQILGCVEVKLLGETLGIAQELFEYEGKNIKEIKFRLEKECKKNKLVIRCYEKKKGAIKENTEKLAKKLGKCEINYYQWRGEKRSRIDCVDGEMDANTGSELINEIGFSGEMEWNCTTPFMEGEKYQVEIVKHLEKFHKVIYTNGLEFYQLVLSGHYITVKKLTDLTGFYRGYKESKTDKEKYNSSKATEEWNSLISQLSQVAWLNEINCETL